LDSTPNPEKPDLGNYDVYSSKLKVILQSADQEQLLYERLKAAILADEISVNTKYIPANSRVFSIMFYHKDLSETVIRAVVGQDIHIKDPLVEHRNDILKAVESCIWSDVHANDINDCIYTLEMQRHYLQKRYRNRSIYYGAKELASQPVTDCRYEKLRQVSITFILEENTTPESSPMAKMQFVDVNTKEIYSDLITLYEVNLNKISQDGGQGFPEDLVILKAFLTIKTHEDLQAFVNTYDTVFSKRLVTEYMHAIIDDETLIKVEGSEKYMLKLSEEVLLEEREEGRREGKLEGKLEGEAIGITKGIPKGELKNLIMLIHRKKLKNKTRDQIIAELELEGAEIETLDNFDNYTYLLR
jgi:hypothetical protein